MIARIPQHAERIDLMAVYRTRRQPSKFLKGIEAITAYCECPACHADHDHPGLDPIKCKCGLSMQFDGPNIFVWRDAAATVE